MKKPEEITEVKKYYDYHDMIHWVEHKYKIQVRDYYGRFGKNGNSDAPYCDFWHWITETYLTEIHNGCERHIDIRELMDVAKHSKKGWVVKIVELLKEEFFEDKNEITVWIDW